MGTAYGVLMRSLGFEVWCPIIMSILIFAGSMQFVAANLLIGPFTPISALLLTLLVNARHIFYGLSMLDRYRDVGKKKWYLIFGMCDETFSINCTIPPPPGIDRGWFYFFVTLFDHSYWIAGSTLGAVFGSYLTVDVTGIEFVMTALFLVILVNQWEKEDHHISTLCGLGISVACLLIFGQQNFILPAMLGILAVLTLMKNPIERREAKQECHSIIGSS